MAARSIGRSAGGHLNNRAQSDPYRMTPSAAGAFDTLMKGDGEADDHFVHGACTFTRSWLRSWQKYSYEVTIVCTQPLADGLDSLRSNMLSDVDNELLCRVGPGTPMGNLMRQYWMPAIRSDELPSPDCPPVRIRLLGENLIGYRTTSGEAGLIQSACPHRGASLFFGRNEEEGLRCVYNGWKFDVTGACTFTRSWLRSWQKYSYEVTIVCTQPLADGLDSLRSNMLSDVDNELLCRVGPDLSKWPRHSSETARFRSGQSNRRYTGSGRAR